MKPEDSYHNQRRDRLSDVVGDYLTDESLTAQDFYKGFDGRSSVMG